MAAVLLDSVQGKPDLEFMVGVKVEAVVDVVEIVSVVEVEKMVEVERAVALEIDSGPCPIGMETVTTGGSGFTTIIEGS